jgi:hypothetical protein
MYSYSLRTLVLVFSLWMTAFEMYFMATRWPVTVCCATNRGGQRWEVREGAATHS